jgi:hypothetical protein
MPAPSLEKECDVVVDALIAYFAHPIGVHWARPRSAFPAYNHPIDADEIELAHAANKRFDR